jgi:hypothetical protein
MLTTSVILSEQRAHHARFWRGSLRVEGPCVLRQQVG